jgi:hypothetical protein
MVARPRTGQPEQNDDAITQRRTLADLQPLGPPDPPPGNWTPLRRLPSRRVVHSPLQLHLLLPLLLPPQASPTTPSAPAAPVLSRGHRRHESRSTRGRTTPLLTTPASRPINSSSTAPSLVCAPVACLRDAGGSALMPPMPAGEACPSRPSASGNNWPRTSRIGIIMPSNSLKV